MLTSLALIFIFGLLFGRAFKDLKLPSLIGMMIAGIIIEPYFLEWLSDDIMDMAPALRQIALVIILTRAGLSLDLRNFKSIGRPTLLLIFLPALLEILGIFYLAPILFDITSLEALLLGCVIAAVSPAVIVPRMLALKEKGYGQKRRIPEMITLASSMDDIFVIVLFTTVLNLATKGDITSGAFYTVPTSILLGGGFGVLVGIGFLIFIDMFDLSHLNRILVLMSMFFLCLQIESLFTGVIGFSGLLSVMTAGITIRAKAPKIARSLADTFEELWNVSSIWLFVLVGASLNISIISGYGFWSLLVIIVGLLCRSVGVFLSLIKTKFTSNEKQFIVYSYLPKATVQAAIGGIPLAAGLPCGELILTVSIISILVTAPLGAFLIDRNGPTLLRRITKES